MDEYVKVREAGKPTIYLVDNVIQFIKLSTSFSMDGKVIFRGQTEDWSLMPSIGRKKHRLSDEEKSLGDFRREAIPYLTIKPENSWQWLALAQHNGLPTRFLDWTKNPLVALWFAVKDASSSYSPRIIWAYLYEEEICHCDSPFDIEKPCIYFPEHVFPYIQAQSGIFTAHHRTRENPSTFPPFEVEDGDLRLSKIEIASDRQAIIAFRYGLKQLGIHSATMFPGLGGIADRIKYDNEWRDDEVDAFKFKKRYIQRKSR